jgi:CRISPR-associated protein Cas2
MNYIISYDISDDKIRNKISGILEDYGVRVQYSVFECWIEEEHLKSLTELLENEMKDDGNIRIYPLCKNCFEKSIGIGKVEKNNSEDGYVVF